MDKTMEQVMEERLCKAARAFQEHRSERIPTNVYVVIENADVKAVDYTHIYTAKKVINRDDEKFLNALAESFDRAIKQHSIDLLKK